MRNGNLVWFAAFLASFAIPYAGTRFFLRVSDRAEPQMSELSSSRDVCIYQNGSYQLIDGEEYLLYALAGSYDASWEPEMTKTMAVVCRTAIYYEMNDQADTANGGGKIINESDLKEIRYEPEELQEMWGDSYDENFQAVYNAVKDTMGQVLTYEEKLILPVYHAVSIGNTVSAEEIYGTAIPYLVSVDSSEDLESPEFSSTKIYSEIRLKKEFELTGDTVLSESAETTEEGTEDVAQETVPDPDTLAVIEATTSGFVEKVNVFGTEMTGETFANVLALGSTNFHIDLVEDGYRIITIGQGNSIGLSLYGAAARAAQGSTYKEILQHYYQGTTLQEF